MKLTIQKKIIVLIIIFAAVLMAVGLVVYGRSLTNLNDSYYYTMVTNVSRTAANVVDAERFVRLRDKVLAIYDSAENKVQSSEWGSDEWNAYTALFDGIDKDEDYIALRDQLRAVQDVNIIDCIYMIYVDIENKCYVYIVDGAHEDPCPPGCIDPLYYIDEKFLADPEYGFPATIVDTDEYGALVTGGVPLHDSNGAVVGYVATDVLFEDVRTSQTGSEWRFFGFLTAALLVCCLLSIAVVNRLLVKPIKQLTSAASAYLEDDTSIERTNFAKLRIKTGDELADLAEAMKRMERSINRKIKQLMSMDDRLIMSQNAVSRMTELANKDALTGVRNKTSYDNYVSKLEETLKRNPELEFGVVMADLNYLKQTNDTYGHVAGDAAIIKLSNLICAVFSHSPVFRVGGDEFVIILQNHDYQCADELIAEIDAKIDSMIRDEALPPEQRVSAAVGIARYERGADTGYSDVFNRADRNMYEKKRVMKGE